MQSITVMARKSSDASPKIAIKSLKYDQLTVDNDYHLSTKMRSLTLPDDRRGSSGSCKSFDITVFNFLKVSPEEYAQQITLLDLACFKCIESAELASRSWNNSKEKHKNSPNIVAFTRRFNQINFWVQRTILDQISPKSRSEYITHFIKIAKKLYELSNLHAEYAIILGLKGLPVERLRKSWELVTRKDKHTLDKLSTLFDESDNHHKLRQMVSSKVTNLLPCIPHIGIYLRDLIYIDTVSPKVGNSRARARVQQENDVLDTISALQRASLYDHLHQADHIQTYLNSVRYIEELQKFLEDELYKTSLKVEPGPSSQKSTGSKSSSSSTSHFPKSSPSKDDLSLIGKPLSANHGTPFTVTVSVSQAVSEKQQKKEEFEVPTSTFVPSHRKAKSLGSNIFGSSAAAGGAKPAVPGAHKQQQHHDNKACLILDDCHHTPAGSAGPLHGAAAVSTPNPAAAVNTLTVVCSGGSAAGSGYGLNGAGKQRPSPASSFTDSLSLSHTSQHTSDLSGCSSSSSSSTQELEQSPAAAAGAAAGSGVEEEERELRLDFHSDCPTHSNVQMEGCVRRKTIQKYGSRKPAISHWHRYWLVLAENYLYYYPPKPFHHHHHPHKHHGNKSNAGQNRAQFSDASSKRECLDGWLAFMPDSGRRRRRHTNLFILTDPRTGVKYKFKCVSQVEASQWFTRINDAAKLAESQDLITLF